MPCARSRRLLPRFVPARHKPKAAPFNWHSSEVLPETRDFLAALFARCEAYRTTACLTLTAIHPVGSEPTPSRHIPLHEPDQLDKVLQRLQAANELGWGAYFAVGLRRQGLERWRRGGKADILALPALFVDLDDHTPQALAKLRDFMLPPSCIVDSGGGGFHAYWWLDKPTVELDRAKRMLQALTAYYSSDALSVAQSLRLPQTRNTKPHRGGLCHVIDFADHHYTLADFEALLPMRDWPLRKPEKPCITTQTVHTVQPVRPLNPALIEAVVDGLCRNYGGYRKENGYIAALCPCGHAHDAPGKHFNFDPTHGIGVCFGRHGRILLKDICTSLGIQPAVYGGLFASERKVT
ncbi:hypothetical protein FBR02_06135 [Anaerolineae bacterium CFX9]|jgi:hypothetical protein|nr:hypothetical protein [Anaerolineae bacterium CFX9]